MASTFNNNINKSSLNFEVEQNHSFFGPPVIDANLLDKSRVKKTTQWTWSKPFHLSSFLTEF